MFRLRRFAPLICLAAPLLGCAGVKVRPDVRLPSAYEAPSTGPALTTQELDHWWLLFRDPALDGLESQAFATAPDARTAEARILEARAARASAVDQTLPQGNVAAQAGREHESNIGAPVNSLFPIGGVYETDQVNLNISWELDLFGRLALQRRIAKADLAAARFDVEGSRASLAASVADDYFQAVGLMIQIEDAKETVRIDADLENVSQEKADRGLGATSDADRVAGDLAQARAQQVDLESQLHAIERQLLILVGRGRAPIESLKLPARAATDDPPPVPAAIPGDLLARRPDVREAEAHLRSEKGTDRLRHLAIFPTFTLLPGLGASHTVQPSVAFIPPATLIPDQQTTNLGFWTLAGGVSVPLLNIPRLLADARAEDARTVQAAIAYEKTVQTAYGEAENALVNLDAGTRASAVLSAGEVRAKRASDAAHTRYNMGLDDITSALTAEEAWRATRAALTSERVQALRRAVVTYKALGGGWTYATLAKAR